jgi:hypothetical protein
MSSILDRLSGEQSSFTMEGETIFDLLEIWLTEKSGENIGKEVTSAQLCSEFAAIAASKKIEFIYKEKTRSFAQRLRNIMSTLREFYDIRERPGKARSRYLSFRPKTSEGELKAKPGEIAPMNSPQSPPFTSVFTQTLISNDEYLHREGEKGEMTLPI